MHATCIILILAAFIQYIQKRKHWFRSVSLHLSTTSSYSCKLSYNAQAPHANYSLGNLRNKSPRWSIGAVISPTAVSNGGLSGANGCERVGRNIFVRPNDFESSRLSSSDNTFSIAGRSSDSSSLICWRRSLMRASIVGTNVWSDGASFWNRFRSFLTYCKMGSENLRTLLMDVNESVFYLLMLLPVPIRPLLPITKMFLKGRIKQQFLTNRVTS